MDDVNFCPVHEAIQLLQEKWTLHIVRALLQRPLGSTELGRGSAAVTVRAYGVRRTGYNGPAAGMPRCSGGGCHRCPQRDAEPYLRGGAYDVCLCVHAEQNALLTAARFGQQTFGASLTSTTQPCFGCLKEMLQAGITEVRYLHPWDPIEASKDEALAQQYAELRSRFTALQTGGHP